MTSARKSQHSKGCYRKLKRLGYFAFLSSVVVLMTVSNANSLETLEQLRDARNAYIEHFRRTGMPEAGKAEKIETQLKAIVEQSRGEHWAKALFELATIQRLTQRFEEAIGNFERAAKIAGDLKNRDLLFDAYLGIARCHAYGTRNHGAAAAAFDHAVASVGDDPSAKQRYQISDYASQIQAYRGELDSALINGLEAIRFALDDADSFYALLDTGDVLQKFAESCDYRKLIDAETINDEDSWGACRRAVGTAKEYYIKAQKAAQRLGWRFLEKQTEGFIERLGMRLLLIDQKASFEKIGQTGVFKTQDVRDVLVNENFEAGASTLSDSLFLGAIIDEVAPESRAHDPRSIYLRGLKADLDGQPEQALAYFQQAARLLREERSSLFEPRRRGTVVENRIEIVRDLGLRLLSFNQLEDAFTAFESVRSFGLSNLAAALEDIQISDAERQSLADLVQLESQASAIQNLLVESTIAGIESSRSSQRLKEIDRIRKQHRKLLLQPKTQGVIEKLSSVKPALPTLYELQQAVGAAGIPVLLFWVTHTNVIAWVISPEDLEVKAVFLPEVAVIDKVKKITTSIRNKKFDNTSARELHTYLIKPFSKQFTRKQILVIPQGPLLSLPFEVLIDPETGRFLAEDVAVSYAPNAAFALRVLKNPLPAVSKILAVYDEHIENQTKEISRIAKLSYLQINAREASNLTESEVSNLLGQAENVHVLFHGEYNSEDPLQSTITLSSNPMSSLNREGRTITAAELLAIDWRDTDLAVFSSCEGAVVQTRISNEMFGISWALLAGGVDHVVLSRWRVNAQSNADWMETFYMFFASGSASPTLAVAEAMRTMIKSGQRDPFYWAGPQVFGR